MSSTKPCPPRVLSSHAHHSVPSGPLPSAHTSTHSHPTPKNPTHASAHMDHPPPRAPRPNPLHGARALALLRSSIVPASVPSPPLYTPPSHLHAPTHRAACSTTQLFPCLPLPPPMNAHTYTRIHTREQNTPPRASALNAPAVRVARAGGTRAGGGDRSACGTLKQARASLGAHDGGSERRDTYTCAECVRARACSRSRHRGEGSVLPAHHA